MVGMVGRVVGLPQTCSENSVLNVVSALVWSEQKLGFQGAALRPQEWFIKKLAGLFNFQCMDLQKSRL